MKHKHLGNTLDSFELFYEEMERKPVAKTSKPVVKVDKSLSTKTVSLKERFNNVKSAVRGRFDNVKKKLNLQRKKAKKMTKAEKLAERKAKLRGIIGIGLLFVVVSIAYSTYMTNLFVDGHTMVIALAPQVAFAIAVSFYAFYKLFK